MGLSIHYNGKFSKKASLSELILEVSDIVKILKWEHKIYLDSFPKDSEVNHSHDGKLYGISFIPPKCEPVSLCFLSNRRMSDFMHLKLYGESKDKLEQDLLYMLASKTQFAGIEIHKAIIQLFRYLYKKGYFEELNLTDEGDYWETDDEEQLKQRFKVYGDLLDNFTLAMESIPMNNKESYEKYFERLMKRVNDRNKNESK